MGAQPKPKPVHSAEKEQNVRKLISQGTKEIQAWGLTSTLNSCIYTCSLQHKL
jgi:hypothetical protein